MGSSGSYSLLAIAKICYLLGVAGIVAGILGPAWWVKDAPLATFGAAKREEGLLKTCEPTTSNQQQSKCTDRDYVLKFKTADELGEGKTFIEILFRISFH